MHTTQHPGATPSRRAAVILGAGLLAAGMLVVPTAATAAFAAPLPATSEAACSVSAATLNWGVKESFRSYISGSIANGEWTVSDDMRYETPDFIWDKATAAFSSDLESGTIGFTGAVHFTGHDGAMKLDLADPVIEFEGADTAYLTLTIGATDAADAGGEATAVPVRAAKIDLTDAVTSGGTELGIQGAVPRLTSEGAAALNGEYGSYVAGEELDPIVLTATVTGCTLGEATAVTPAPTDPTDPAAPVDPATPADGTDAAAPTVPWLPIAIGGVALLVIGVTGGMLLAGRKKPQTPANQAPANQAPANQDPQDTSSGV